MLIIQTWLLLFRFYRYWVAQHFHFHNIDHQAIFMVIGWLYTFTLVLQLFHSLYIKSSILEKLVMLRGEFHFWPRLIKMPPARTLLSVIYWRQDFYRTQVQSLPCLASKSLTPCFCCSYWICQSCYMDFSKLLIGFVKVDIWISLSCYMDLSKLMHGFLKVVTGICQDLYMDFS